jgi:Right handed beta helix region
MLGIHGLPARRLAASPRRRHALIVEGLEDRLLLSGDPTMYTVTSTSGSPNDKGSLPDVINLANSNTNPAGSVIQFDKMVFATPQIITLTSTLNLEEKPGPEVINGPGENLVTVSGDNAVRVFLVEQPSDNVGNMNGVTATISGLTISSGGVLSYGGGILNLDTLDTLTVSDCTIANNTAGHGGGIANSGTLTVSDCTIANNTADFGGGIDNSTDGTLTVSYCTIDYNTAPFGGGIYNELSSPELPVTLTVSNSTIAYNKANGSKGSGGGGIWNNGALTVFNSTIAYNSAYSGGGINNNYGLTVVNSTIFHNTAPGGGGGLSGPGAVTLNNTIVAGNLSGTSADDIPDRVPVKSSAYNLIGTGGSGGLTNGVNGNQVGVANPGLATALTDNGGPTQTIALLKGSPAIDKGSNTLAVDPNTNQPLATDQRGTGFPRIVNGTVDIGAYEFQATAPMATHLVVTAQPPGSVTAGSGFSLVVAAENSLGNVDPTFNGNVTISLAKNPGGSTLGGTTTVAAKGGVAIFTGLTLNNPSAGYTIQIAGGGLIPATTNLITVQAPPKIQRATVVLTQQRNKRGKPIGKPVLTGFQFTFNSVMNSATAGNPNNYRLGTYVQVRVRVGKKFKQVLQLKPIAFTVKYDPASNSVKLLIGKQAFTRGGQITIVSAPPGGISSAAGGFLDGNGDGTGGGNAVYNISANARRISHA